MKKYFILDSSNYVDYGIRKSPKLGAQSVMLGRNVDDSELPSLIFEHNFPRGEPIPHYLTGGTVLASKLFIELLGDIGVYNFQSFPALLLNPETGEKREDFHLFNVLGLMKVADLDASRYDEIMGGAAEGVDVPLAAFTDLAIDGEKLHGVDMFRLAEDPTSLIVSNRIVDSLKQNKPQGGWGLVIEEVEVV